MAVFLVEIFQKQNKICGNCELTYKTILKVLSNERRIFLLTFFFSEIFGSHLTSSRLIWSFEGQLTKEYHRQATVFFLQCHRHIFLL